MNLTRSVSYGVAILLRVGQAKTKRPLTATQISKGCKFPPRFLYRVLRRLVDAGLLTGISGPGGGYALARSLSKISLLDVVIAVEGNPSPEKIDPICSKQTKAVARLHKFSTRNHRDMTARLRSLKLGQLAKP